MNNLSPAKQALRRTQEAIRQKRRIELFKIRDRLRFDGTFAFFAEVEADEFHYWYFGPDPASVVRLLLEIKSRHAAGEARVLDNGFTIPVFRGRSQDVTDADDPGVARALTELKYMGNCRLAAAWKRRGSEMAHVRLLDYSPAEAFSHFADCITDEIYAELSVGR